MSDINELVENLTSVRDKIKTLKKEFSEIRKIEKELLVEIQNYLNENDFDGIKIHGMEIKIIPAEKNIKLKRDSYQKKVYETLREEGFFCDKNFVNKLMDNTSVVIPITRIKIKEI
jgi:hypothetical protein